MDKEKQRIIGASLSEPHSSEYCSEFYADRKRGEIWKRGDRPCQPEAFSFDDLHVFLYSCIATILACLTV